jgi:TetR/AcrR family transcriptional regulator, tetracycline repressor protein
MGQSGKSASPQQRSRAQRGTISREQLVDLATSEVIAGRYEQLTVRQLAARLGVAPMSLYRHVRDKNDLLNEVVDRLLAVAWEPSADRADHWAWIAEAADRLRHLLVTEPAALTVYLEHPVTTPTALARMRAMLGVLERAGLDEAGARRVFAIVHTYTLGFAALEASRSRWLRAHEDVTDPDIGWLAGLTSPQQFTDGLGVLIADGRRAAGAR